jgi:hypothetical protein
VLPTLAFIGLLLAPGSPGERTTLIKHGREPLATIKKSPKKFPPKNQPFEFEWLTEGYGQAWTTTSEPQLRFRLFCQERKVHESLAEPAVKLLLKLWEYCYFNLKIDHKPDYNKSVVDVYLCWDGDPGGEQLFDDDPQIPLGNSSKVNTIYIYDLPSFTNTTEKVREIAHEYGHAVLPSYGGYKAPEYWANGYLGEKLFMTYLADQMQRGLVTGADAMGISKQELTRWVNMNSTPMMITAALRQPASLDFKPAGETSMDNGIGLYLWLQAILPPELLGRVLRMSVLDNSTNLPKSIIESLEGAPSFSFNIPLPLQNRSVFVPLGSGRITGATVVSKSGGWAKIKAGAGKVTISP